MSSAVAGLLSPDCDFPQDVTMTSRGFKYMLERDGVTVRCVGKGSFGQALLVKDEHQQVFVAKELNLKTMSKKDRRSSENEVKLLAQLDHPFVIKFVDCFVDPTHKLFIIMEFADGTDLGAKIKQQKRLKVLFTEDQIMLWFTQLCLALDHLHDKKILHRDLKTMNVFLTSNDVVKLGDFGFSKRLHTASMAHTVWGTPYYFSPELCQGQAYSNKSDIWSLGIILYEMAMLSRPYEADNMQELMKKVVYGDYTPPSPTCPSFITKLISCLLLKKDVNRPSVARILLHSHVQKYLGIIPSLLHVTAPSHRYPTKTTAVASPEPTQVEAVAAATTTLLAQSQAVTESEMKVLKSQVTIIPSTTGVDNDNLVGDSNEQNAVTAVVANTNSKTCALLVPDETTPLAPVAAVNSEIIHVSSEDMNKAEYSAIFEEYASDFEDDSGSETQEEPQQQQQPLANKRSKLENALGKDTVEKACLLLSDVLLNMSNEPEETNRILEGVLAPDQMCHIPLLTQLVMENISQLHL